MKFKNTFNTPLKEIFLEDWANSYIDNNTNLAKRISDEYSRSFSFAQKKQRGSTFIKEVKSLRIKDWNRSKNASDIIQLNLKEPLLNNESVELEIRYTIKLPDSKFTGYGYDRNNIYLTNWLIVFSNIYNSEWLNQSNLNLDDQSLRKSSYKLKISFDKDYNLFSNLKTKNTKVVDDVKTTSLIGSDIKDVKINLLVEDNFKTFVSKKNQIETDIFKISSPSEAKVRVNRVINFIMNYFNDKNNNLKVIVSKKDYESNPFYGLNELPSFISPFSDEFFRGNNFFKIFCK
jgi:hypothetical protein